MILMTMLTALAAPIDTLPHDPTALPPRLSQATDGLRFTDKHGLNIVTWDTRHSVSVWHYRIQGGRLFLVNTAFRARPDCDDDLAFGLSGGVAVTDADSDGTAEVTFAVEEACVTDVSARDLEITLWEGGEQYTVSGQSIWWDSAQGGTVVPLVFDHRLASQPALLQRAEQHFDAIIEAERTRWGDDVVLRRQSIR